MITYSYDGLLRLIGADASIGDDYAYSYDEVGNRTGVWINGTRVLTLTHDAANQVEGWEYDAAGNLLNDGTTTYGYDALNRLVQQERHERTPTTVTACWCRAARHEYTQDLAAPLSQILANHPRRNDRPITSMAWTAWPPLRTARAPGTPATRWAACA